MMEEERGWRRARDTWHNHAETGGSEMSGKRLLGGALVVAALAMAAAGCVFVEEEPREPANASTCSPGEGASEWAREGDGVAACSEDSSQSRPAKLILACWEGHPVARVNWSDPPQSGYYRDSTPGLEADYHFQPDAPRSPLSVYPRYENAQAFIWEILERRAWSVEQTVGERLDRAGFRVGNLAEVIGHLPCHSPRR